MSHPIEIDSSMIQQYSHAEKENYQAAAILENKSVEQTPDDLKEQPQPVARSRGKNASKKVIQQPDSRMQAALEGDQSSRMQTQDLCQIINNA